MVICEEDYREEGLDYIEEYTVITSCTLYDYLSDTLFILIGM